MEIKIDSSVKGTRILFAETASKKRDLINTMINFCKENRFTEMMIPVVQLQESFSGKVGNENQKMMYNFQDQGGRNLCLAPEYTAIIQQLSNTVFKFQKNVKLFYVQECFRGEKPQAGRYREFTQFGVEIINPDNKLDLGIYKDLASFAYSMIELGLGEIKVDLQINKEATRGLDYYKEGKGFEISCDQLGAQKQICGGGEYVGGVGFAVGVDRLLLIK